MTSKLLDESQRPRYFLNMLQHWLEVVLNMTVGILAVIFVALATQVRGFSAGSAGVGLISLMAFGGLLNGLVRNFTYLETATGALSRLRSFIDKAPAPEGSASSDSADTSSELPPDWPARGTIKMDNVSASYE